MKKIISLLSFVCIVLSIQSVNATSVLPAGYTASLPSYCFGVNVERPNDEIELNLLTVFGKQIYDAENGVTFHVNSIIPRTGGTSVKGVVSGVLFAGGGSQSWEMDFSITRAGINGTLTRHTKTFYGSGSSEYKLICE